VLDDDALACRDKAKGTTMSVTTTPAATKLPKTMRRIFFLLKLRLKMKDYSILTTAEISLIYTLEQPLLESMFDWLCTGHHQMDVSRSMY
jgi:hypothetical protein